MSDDEMQMPCPVLGCQYTLPYGPGDDRTTFLEDFEQHVRWIHVQPRDFGENPVPSLSALMMNGLIRPDEFAELMTEIVSGELEKIMPDEPPISHLGTRLWLGLVGTALLGTAAVANVFVGGNPLLRFFVSVSLGAGIGFAWANQVLLRRIMRASAVPRTEYHAIAMTEDPTQGGHDE